MQPEGRRQSPFAELIVSFMSGARLTFGIPGRRR